jgi:hypothetical protein
MDGTRIALVATAWLLAGSAFGSDGVIELNQARALAGGPGDAPGFPLVIATTGSYRLTSDLVASVGVLGSPPVSILQIEAPHVTVDLNGFSLRCIRVLTVAVPCASSPSGTSGQAGMHVFATNASISNGSISGMAGPGIFAGSSGTSVDRLRIVDNGGDGLLLGSGGRVARTRTSGNGGGSGIRLTGGSTVIDTSWFEDGIAQQGGSLWVLTCIMSSAAVICPP